MGTAKLAVGGWVALVLIMTVALGSAGAATPFTSRASGSYVSPGTMIDTNGDGKTADLVFLSGDLVSSGQGKGSLGAATMQAVLEWSATFTWTDPCFNGTLVSGTFVIRMANGDLVYGVFTPGGTNCYDPSANSASISLTGVFTGGTGRFKSALYPGGSIAVTATAQPLVGDESISNFPEGKFGNQFGAVEATFTGTLP